MSDNWSASDVAGVLGKIAEGAIPHADRLRELDAKIGDGDLGVTITKGLTAVKESLESLSGEDVGTIIAKSGVAFNKAAASTFGAIFATALMRAGKAVQGQDNITLADLPEMGRVAIEGIKERGKADVGDKTVLDALVPLVDALEESITQGASADNALSSALDACRQGVDETIPMRSQVSRASWVGERSIGVADPGATALLVMFESAIAD